MHIIYIDYNTVYSQYMCTTSLRSKTNILHHNVKKLNINICPYVQRNTHVRDKRHNRDQQAKILEAPSDHTASMGEKCEQSVMSLGYLSKQIKA